MFTFPLVVLATDLTVRISNPFNARVIVSLAFIPAIIISSYLADFRIGIASATAYIIGQTLDITVFQRIRERVTKWWVAPLVSTVCANIIETYTFFGTAFYNSTNVYMSEHWLAVATVDLIFKILIGIILFLPAYGILLRYILKKVGK